MTDRERVYSYLSKECDYTADLMNKITELERENGKLKQRVSELEKTKKKRKFRAMTYKEYCKSLYLICEDCVFAPNWADKYYKHICPIRNKSSNDFDKPCKLPNGTAGFLKSKSGLNVKHGITSEGVIDVGYTGSIVCKLYNNSNDDYQIKRGDKITQLVIVKIETPNINIVDKLDKTERGEGGFGSTGR